jgi:hypothetical protein
MRFAGGNRFGEQRGNEKQKNRACRERKRDRGGGGERGEGLQGEGIQWVEGRGGGPVIIVKLSQGIAGMLLIQKGYAPSCACLQENSSQVTSPMVLCALLRLATIWNSFQLTSMIKGDAVHPVGVSMEIMNSTHLYEKRRRFDPVAAVFKEIN